MILYGSTPVQNFFFCTFVPLAEPKNLEYMENAKEENEKKVWSQVSLEIDWSADFHSEYHRILFDRPTEENPNPEFPVKVGEELSIERLPMSSEWGQLYAPIVVKAFDEHSLTFQYGENEHTIDTENWYYKFGEQGMNYTRFYLKLKLELDHE